MSDAEYWAQEAQKARAESRDLRAEIASMWAFLRANPQATGMQVLLVVDPSVALNAGGVPLADEQVRDAYMTTNTATVDQTYAAFRAGVRFAERAHGIDAARAEKGSADA